MSTRPQDIHRSVTRLHFRLAHTGRRRTNTARLQKQQPLSSTDGFGDRAFSVAAPRALNSYGTETHALDRQQHSSVILRHFCSIQHTSPTNYGMRHRANCRRRTTNAAVTVTVSRHKQHKQCGQYLKTYHSLHGSAELL